MVTNQKEKIALFARKHCLLQPMLSTLEIMGVAKPVTIFIASPTKRNGKTVGDQIIKYKHRRKTC